MAQLDPQLLATLMPSCDGLDDEEYKHHIQKMSEDQRMEEAIQRNKMDNDITDLYMECFTDKHLDLAALLMEQHAAAEHDPELVLTDTAKKMIAWAKAVVAMQLILIAAQSAMSEESRKAIEKLSRSGQEVIALNYRRCKSDIDRMLVELADASAAVENAQNNQLHGKATVQQLHAQVQDMEQRMREIVKTLEENKQDEATTLQLAIEYAALKAGSNAIASDTKLRDPQKALLDDWLIKNYTPPLQEAAGSVLAGSAYPELKTWANAMDAVKAFASTQTIALLNELLLKVGNEVKAHRSDIENFLLAGQTPNNKTRKRLPGGAVDYNTDAIYFIKDLSSMDEEDWNDACISLPSSAVAAARAAQNDPNYETSNCNIDTWIKTTIFLSEFVAELSKNMHTITEQREQHSNLLVTLLQTNCSLYDEFKSLFSSDHLKIAEGIQQGSYLYEWASAIIAISRPPPYSIFDTISLSHQRDCNLIENHPKEDIIATHDAALYLKSMISLQTKEWVLVSKTIESHITDDNTPPEAAEWACAAVELKGYLKTTQENMRKIVILYQKYATDINTLLSLTPSPAHVPAPPPQVRQNSLEPSTPVPEIGQQSEPTPLVQPTTEPEVVVEAQPTTHQVEAESETVTPITTPATATAPLMNSSQGTQNEESPGPADDDKEEENDEADAAEADTEDDGTTDAPKEKKIKRKKKKNSIAGPEEEGGAVERKRKKKKKKKSGTGATGDESSCTASPPPTPTGVRRRSSAKAKLAKTAENDKALDGAPAPVEPTVVEKEAPIPTEVSVPSETVKEEQIAVVPVPPVKQQPPQPPLEAEPPKPRVIEVRPLKDSPPAAPVTATTPGAIYDDKDDVYHAKRVVVKPAKQVRTIREAVLANPNIAAGIIFVRPKQEEN